MKQEVLTVKGKNNQNSFRNMELHNVKFSGVLKIISEAFITNEIDTNFQKIEMLKDDATGFLSDDKGNFLKGYSLKEIKEEGVNNTPIARSILINFGTYVIRRNFLRYAFLSVENEKFKDFSKIIENLEVKKIKQIIDFFDNKETAENLSFLNKENINKISIMKDNFSTDLSNLEKRINEDSKLLSKFIRDFRKEEVLLQKSFDITFSEFGQRNIMEFDQLNISHPKFNVKKSVKDMFSIFSKQLNNFIKDNFNVLAFGKDVWTEIGLSTVSNIDVNKEMFLITDGRFRTEFEIAMKKFPSLKTTLILPMKEGKLHLDNSENILKLYNDSKTINEFVNLSSAPENQFVMIAEELSTLLVVNNYLKKYEPEKVNPILDKELNNNGFSKDRLFVIENERGRLFNLSTVVKDLMSSIKEEAGGLTVLSTISRGGKDTVLSIMQNITEGKKFDIGIDFAHLKINTTIEKLLKDEVNFSDNELMKKVIEKNPEDEKNIKFLFGTTLGDSYKNDYSNGKKNFEKKIDNSVELKIH